MICKGTFACQVVEDKAANQSSLSELSSYRWGNMSKMAVQLHNGELLYCNVGSVMITNNMV